jgi:hypothetical protein
MSTPRAVERRDCQRHYFLLPGSADTNTTKDHPRAVQRPTRRHPKVPECSERSRCSRRHTARSVAPTPPPGPGTALERDRCADMSGPIVGGSAVISGARSARFAISEMGQIGSSALPALSCELTPKRVSMDSAINICLNLIEGLAGHRRHCVKRIQLTTRLRARACVIARTRRERQRCDRKSDGETDCAHLRTVCRRQPLSADRSAFSSRVLGPRLRRPQPRLRPRNLRADTSTTCRRCERRA